MATAREERLAALRARANQIDYPDILSVSELARSEEARVSRHFGFAQPAFRTSLSMRFTGEGVNGHDLRGSIAGEVVGGVTAAVEAAAGDRKLPPASAELFLSPVVLPGSTILELFAKRVERNQQQEHIDTEIDDSPADVAISHLFTLLDTVNETPLGEMAGSDIEVGSRLGQKLFNLSNSLIDSEVDLELSWTRPRGRVRGADFSRQTANGFRALLDKETTERERVTEAGTLEHISTDGTIGFSFDGRLVKVDGSGLDAELLRSLWAQTVELQWNEVTISHARRAQSKTAREAVSIRKVQE